MAEARLTRGRHERILHGHPWIYANEIQEVRGEFQPGDIVSVLDSRGKFIGRGYINPRSQISIRLLTRQDVEVSDEFIRRRLEQAVQYRQLVVPHETSFRVVHAEADLLPGLVVDKFGDYLVFQTLTLGIERFRGVIVSTLLDMFRPRGMYERNDAPVRELEGLRQTVGFVTPPFDTVIEIEENGLRITVDVQRGQKTGHFLDQKENRMAIRPYCKGARVLDCFCHTGGFSLNAAKAGALEVTGIDQSESALLVARANAMDNDLTGVSFESANAFDYLRMAERRGLLFDVVILDPPAFAKSRGALEGAVRGYKEINLRAMRIIRSGGTLVTCSCSHHMDEALFTQVIIDSAFDARKTVRLIEKRGQAKDHPVLLASPETAYLKCFILEVS